MRTGDQARLASYNARHADAAALGHAVLECSPGFREEVCAAAAEELARKIIGLKQSGIETDVIERSIEDLMRAMHRQTIRATKRWQPKLDGVVSADRTRRESLRQGAAMAREKRKRALAVDEALRTGHGEAAPDLVRNLPPANSNPRETDNAV